MSLGPGKYDDLCTNVRLSAMARGVVLIVLGGHKGSGFSVQADAEIQRSLPEMLEHIAKVMRADLGEKGDSLP